MRKNWHGWDGLVIYLLVQVGWGHLQGDLGQVGLGDAAVLLQDVCHGARIHVLHDDDDCSVVQEGLVEPDDGGVVGLGQGAQLHAHLLPHLLLPRVELYHLRIAVSNISEGGKAKGHVSTPIPCA